MVKKAAFVLAVLLCVLMPLGFSVLLSGNETLRRGEVVDVESYLPLVMSGEIPWDYEDEMLKVQAVLARSSLYYALQEDTWNESGWQEMLDRGRENLDTKAGQLAYERMQEAAEETEGLVLWYQGSICPGVFHRLSAGSTREGAAVYEDETHDYLTVVDSRQDAQSADYLQGRYFTEEALRQRLLEYWPDLILTEESLTDQLVIQNIDDQGYVLSIQVGNLVIGGELFRINLDLPSSNFTIQNMDDKIRFLCMGVGHGLGLSQYGGNVLAQEGKTYEEILLTYFPKACIDFVNPATL